MIFSALATVYFAIELNWKVLLIFGISGIISFAYAFPFFPENGERLSLREIPYLKIWLIVLVWILVIGICPMMEMNVKVKWAEINYLLFQSLFILALTIPFDIRDLKVDKPFQKTIPMVLGTRKAVQLAKLFLILYFLLGVVNSLLFSIPAVFILAQFIAASVGIYLVSKTDKKKSNLFYILYIDGVIFLFGISVILSAVL